MCSFQSQGRRTARRRRDHLLPEEPKLARLSVDEVTAQKRGLNRRRLPSPCRGCRWCCRRALPSGNGRWRGGAGRGGTRSRCRQPPNRRPFRRPRHFRFALGGQVTAAEASRDAAWRCRSAARRAGAPRDSASIAIFTAGPTMPRNSRRSMRWCSIRPAPAPKSR